MTQCPVSPPGFSWLSSILLFVKPRSHLGMAFKRNSPPPAAPFPRALDAEVATKHSGAEVCQAPRPAVASLQRPRAPSVSASRTCVFHPQDVCPFPGTEFFKAPASSPVPVRQFETGKLQQPCFVLFSGLIWAVSFSPVAPPAAIVSCDVFVSLIS